MYYMLSEQKESFIILWKDDFYKGKILSNLVSKLEKMDREEVLSDNKTLDEHYIPLFIKAIDKGDKVENCMRIIFHDNKWDALLNLLAINSLDSLTE